MVRPFRIKNCLSLTAIFACCASFALGQPSDMPAPRGVGVSGVKPLSALSQADAFMSEAERLSTTGQSTNAEGLLLRALAIRERALGPDDDAVADTLGQLGDLYKTAGAYSKAEPLYLRAKTIYERAIETNGLKLASLLSRLAGLYCDQGHYDKAQPLLLRALAIREARLGHDNPDVAVTLNDLALMYDAQATYAKAEPLFRRALAIREKALGPEHPDVATSLDNLGEYFREQGDYSQAQSLQTRALAIREKVLGPDAVAVASSLNNLALLYVDQGAYEKAEPLFLRALAIREKALGADHPLVATTLNNLAGLYYRQGAFDKAEPLYNRALAIREKVLGVAHRDVATTLNDLASTYDAEGSYAKSEPLFVRALAIYEKTLGPDHPDLAVSLNTLGVHYKKVGLYEKAEPLFARALAIREASLGRDHPTVATSLNNLAALYVDEGDYPKAEPLYLRALAIQTKAVGADHPAVANSLNNLARLYEDEGDPDRSEPLYVRALEIRERALGAEHPAVAVSLNNLAELYRKQGAYARAEPLYLRALQIREKAFGDRHPDVANSLNNLAALYDLQKKYAEAEPLYVRALAISEQTLGSDHINVANGVSNLAYLYDEQGAYVKAEPLYFRALAIRQKALGPDHPDVAASLDNLAGLYNQWNRPMQALPYTQMAVTIVRANRKMRLLGDGLAAGQATRNRAIARSKAAFEHPDNFIFGRHVQTSWQAISATPALSETLAEEAFASAQDGNLSITAIAAAQAAAKRAAPTQEADILVKQQQDLARALRKLDTQYTLSLADPRRGLEALQLRAQLDENAQALAKVETELERSYPAYLDLSVPKAATVRTVQSRLSSDQALVLITPVDDDNFVFVVTKSDFSFRGILGGAKRSREHIVTVLCDIDTQTCPENFLRSESEGFHTQAAYGLYQDTLEAFEGQLAGVRHLYLVSSGDLSKLPLDLLITQKPGANEDLSQTDWLGARFSLTVLPSVSALTLPSEDAAMSSSEPSFVGYGNPRLKGPSGLDPSNKRGRISAVLRDGAYLSEPEVLNKLPALPGTGEELNQIAALFTQGQVHVLDEDTETSFKNNPSLSRASVVSIATHGILPDASHVGLGESGLVFSPPAKASATDDGLLTASSIILLRFNAEWIVLSACNTATSDNPADGLSTLARAFLFAGSRAVLASHWRVSDAATATLLARTLEIKRQEPILTHAEALQRAAAELRSTPQYQHPRYWASFSLIANSDR